MSYETLRRPDVFLPQTRAQSARPSLAITALTIHVFLIVSRIPELVPWAHLGWISGPVAVATAFTLPPTSPSRLLRSPDARLLVALFCLAAVTIPFSAWPGRSFDHVLFGLSQTVVASLLVLFCIRSPADVFRLLWGLLGAALFLEVRALFFALGDRAQATSSYDSNDTAFFMICFLPVAAFFALSRRGIAKLLTSAVALLAVLTIVRTHSRGGFVALVVIGVMTIVKLPAAGPSFGPSSRLALALTMLFALTLFAPQAYWTRMETIWSPQRDAGASGDYDASGLEEARWRAWAGGIRLMLNNPLLGVGAGAFEVAAMGYAEGLGRYKAAHNSFIQVGAELGVFGLSLFVVLIYRAIRNCWVVARRARQHPRFHLYKDPAQGLVLSLYAFVLAGSALSQAYSLLLYLSMGIAAALSQLTAQLGPHDSIPEQAFIRHVLPDISGRDHASPSS